MECLWLCIWCQLLMLSPAANRCNVHYSPFGNFTHLKKTKICFQWKNASKVNGYSLAAAQTATALSEITFEGQNLRGDVQDDCGYGYSENDKELDPKEARRRMNISKANKGNVPWNKGRKHSPETLERIKERTKQAMQNPKVRLKILEAQHLRAISEKKERKEEVRAILREAWKARRERSLLLQTCVIEWKESIAESARSGGDGEDELHWDSYNTLKEDIHQEWFQAIADNKSIQKENGCRGAAKPADHRQKIAESIKAKWADPEYRKNVTIGKEKSKKCIQKENECGGAAKRDQRQKIAESIKAKWADPEYRKNVMIGREKSEKSNPRKKLIENNSDYRKQKNAREPSIHKKKMQPEYLDPQAEAKLQKLKIIQAQRAALELDKKKATDQAMLLYQKQ